MSDARPKRKSGAWLTLIGPGLLVAATGVGAGDLATGAFTGSQLGVAVLWAVLVGAGLKFVLNEGLTRWQLATGETLLEGACVRLGPIVRGVFLVYLLVWTVFTASALMSATGAVMHAIRPISDARSDKLVYGLVHSLLAVVLVRLGGYRLFEKAMTFCIGIMFFTVLCTTVAMQPDWGQLLKGMAWPTIPTPKNSNYGSGLDLTFALMGGVGGTLTILCYGYWIREEGRSGERDLTLCRADIATGYLMTAVFGMAMVILGSRISIEKGKSAALLVKLASELDLTLGPVARWAFLIGAWGAIASSMLGVWQSVPYLFADFLQITRKNRQQIRDSKNPNSEDSLATEITKNDLTKTGAYRGYLYAMATLPAFGLLVDFQRIQILYAIIGATSMPLLAVILLILNGQSRFVGSRLKNSWFTNLVLIASIGLFLVIAIRKFF